MGGEEDPADILLRAVPLIKDSADFAKRLARLLAALVSAEIPVLAAEGLSPQRRSLLISGFYLAAELPAEADLFSSLKQFLEIPPVEEDARLSRALLQTLCYQQTDASLEATWLSLLDSGRDEPFTPAQRTSLLTAWRGLILVPPLPEDWRAGEIVDFNRLQGGLTALCHKLSRQQGKNFGQDELAGLLETCLDILQETFPRSPGFWINGFQPYLADWPSTLVAMVRSRWSLPQGSSQDQPTSPEALDLESATRLLERTLADSWATLAAQAHSDLQRLEEIRRQQEEIESLIQWARKAG